MKNRRNLTVSILFTILLWLPFLHAKDLSAYRDFHLGMDLAAAIKLAQMDLSEAKVIHQRPALIQELQWMPLYTQSSMSETDPIKEILFHFYNGKLYRILVVYDRYKVQGLKAEDFVESISEIYGPAIWPQGRMIPFPPFGIYTDSEKVIACWEDASYSFNLFYSGSRQTYGMLAYSKNLDTMAQTAMTEADRLDRLEAPQKEMESKKKQADEEQAAREKARPASKANFRP